MAERTWIPNGAILEFAADRYRIRDKVGFGGTALLYSVEEIDQAGVATSQKHFVLKEIFPSKGFCRTESYTVVPNNPEDRDQCITLEYLKKSALNEASTGQDASNTNYRIIPIRKCFASAQITFNACETHTANNTFCLMDDISAQGCSLLEYMRNQVIPMNIEAAILVMRGILEAYSALHVKYIHGDIQAGNIFIMNSEKGEMPVAFILDFGSTLELNAKGVANYNGMLFSSDGYAPPEHFSKNLQSLTPASDVYGLGYIFLSLLKLSPWVAPSRCRDITHYFSSNPTVKTVTNGAQIGVEDSATLSLLNRILQKAMAYDPDERYPNAAAFLEAILHLEDCQKLTTHYGLTMDTMRHAAHRYYKDHPELFTIKHIPKVALDIPVDILDLYGSCLENELPIDEIFEHNKGHKIILEAPGGVGKSFTLSRLFLHYLDRSDYLPIYLNVGHVASSFLSQGSSFTESLLRLISQEYFLCDIPLDSRDQWDKILCNTILILDDFHKMPRNSLHYIQTVFDELSHKYPGIWPIVSLRYCSGSAADRFFLNDALLVKLNCISVQQIQKLIVKTLNRPCSTIEEEWLNLHITFIEKPLFLMRYLELVKLNNRVIFRNMTMHLLDDYFSSMVESLEAKLSRVEAYRFLVEDLPHASFALATKSSLYSNGNNTLNDHSIDESVYEFASDIGVMDVSEDDTWRTFQFRHDVYLGYFSAVWISKFLKKAIQMSNITYLQIINCTWANEADEFWPDLLAGNDPKELFLILEPLFALIKESQPYTTERVAFKIFEVLEKEYKKSGKDATQPVLEWLQLSAEKGYAPAQFILYKQGIQKKASVNSLQFCTQAAAQGHDYAQVALACENISGLRISKDYTRAFAWVWIAANRGCKLALFYYSLMLEFGIGVKRDHSKAMERLIGAIQEGVDEAILYAGTLCFSDRTSTEDRQKLLTVLQYQKNLSAHYCLSVIYGSKESDYCNEEKARRHIKDAELFKVLQSYFFDRSIASINCPEHMHVLLSSLCKCSPIPIDMVESLFVCPDVKPDYEQRSNWGISGERIFEPDHNYCAVVDRYVSALSGTSPSDECYIGDFLSDSSSYYSSYLESEESIEWYYAAANCGYAPAQFKLGKALLHSPEQHLFAMEMLRCAAKAGNIEAQELLAKKLTENDQIVDEDITWLENAAENGNVIAACRLAEMHLEGTRLRKDTNKALHLLEIPAKNGNITACEILSEMYEDGNGVPRDHQKAVRLKYRVKSEGELYYYLAMEYINGMNCVNIFDEVEIDDEKAFVLMKNAADNGYKKAYKHTGEMLYYGKGTCSDIELALKYLYISAQEGDEESQILLGGSLIIGDGIEQNYYEGIAWLNKAAKRGNARAQYILASAYEMGIGHNNEYALALEWLKASADQRYGPALNMLGYYYLNGLGTEVDMDMAIECYRKGVEVGNLDATYYLGYCYLHGYGVTANAKSAKYWLEEAAKKGHEKARQVLSEQYKNRHFEETD